MKVPIPDPLLKDTLLQGLMRSDESKYKHMVLREYAKNLESTFDELRQTMQTVEGLREQEIINEYAPTAALAQADVMTIEGRKPNDHCYFPGHKGHCNKECMKQNIQSCALRDRLSPLTCAGSGMRMAPAHMATSANSNTETKQWQIHCTKQTNQNMRMSQMLLTMNPAANRISSKGDDCAPVF